MRKIIALSLAVTAVSAGLAFADQRPIEWSLPNHGQDCRFQAVFSNAPAQRRSCGQAEYQLWSCTEALGSGTREVQYLIVGEIVSDVANFCSPTFVVKQVVAQKVPLVERP